MNIEHQTSNVEPRARRWPFVQCALGALAVGIFLCSLKAGAQTNTSSSSGPDFDSFKIISQRNIFDPNRSGLRSNYRPSNRPTHVVDAFALVGTMSYEKGKFAFFDGQSSQYKKVLEPGANIAGYTVKNVTPKAVTLAANGKEFQMKIGTQLRNEGANGWRLSAYTDVPSDSNSDQNGEAAGIAQPSTPPVGSSPQMSDVLKRLMQQREQELK